MPKPIETYLVDSFTDTAFKGNHAAVCLLESVLSEAKMQAIAKELGYFETAFISFKKDSHFSIRYFSPKMEIPLCGHATLAASKFLFEKYPDWNSILFQTTENIELPISRIGKQIEMNFPVYEISSANAPAPLLEALGIDAIF